MSVRVITLRATEVNLLRRALMLYRKEYQKNLAPTQPDHIRQEARDYIAAADRLADRLVRGD